MQMEKKRQAGINRNILESFETQVRLETNGSGTNYVAILASPTARNTQQQGKIRMNSSLLITHCLQKTD